MLIGVRFGIGINGRSVLVISAMEPVAGIGDEAAVRVDVQAHHTSVPSVRFVARCVFSEPDTSCHRESDGSQMIPSLTGAPRPTARRQK
ncbi:hypothetical protein C4D60_Mb06t07760 [Musa balbisiana]|uniref:Uncharacterized protein n=1 Tax=Musa balbisiana TaxID=52838 RepID=A0A4S8ILE2_MUSBA|nr:hypothetical protein C4D60_Mb06t07760 [Musa balbisiana]